MGAGGRRLDRGDHRHPVADRQRLPVGAVDHQGAARVRQRLRLQLPRHQLRVGVRPRPAGGGVGGPQAHRLVDSAAVHGRRDRRERGRPGHRRRVDPRGDRRGHRPCHPRRGHRGARRGPQAVLGEGASRGALQGRRDADRRDGRRHPRRMGPAGTVSRLARPRLPVPVRRQPRARLRRRGLRRLRRTASAGVRQRAARPVRRAGADGRSDRAVPLATRRQRVDRRGRVGDPRAARGVRQERLPGLLRHPPRQVGGVRTQRPLRHHLPRGGRRLPGKR